MNLLELKSLLDEERSIVDRIWKLFGPPTFEQLNGRSIYDLIIELQDENKRLNEKLHTTPISTQ